MTDITKYNGTITFGYVYGVKVVEKPVYSIYIVDITNNALVHFDRNYNYVKHVNTPETQPIFVEAINNGNVYVNRYISTNKIYVYNPTLTMIANPSIASTNVNFSSQIRYEPTIDRLYFLDRNYLLDKHS